MTVAVLVLQASAVHLARILPDVDLKFAANWTQLEEFIKKPEIGVAICDPHFECALNISFVAEILRKYPELTVVAYVEPRAASLKAAFALSKLGLSHVFVHPVKKGDVAFRNAVDGISRNQLAIEILATADSRFVRFPPGLVLAISDLFERPYRYERARDLALQSGMSVRALYRRFQASGFGTPRQLLALAKVIGGYVYTSASGRGVTEASIKLGYRQKRCYTRHSREILGCPPSRVLRDMSREEVLLRFVERLRTPSQFRKTRRCLRAGLHTFIERDDKHEVSNRTLLKSGLYAELSTTLPK